MNLVRKSVLSFVGVAAAALLLAVASPRSVHALGEQLVIITNSAAHPANVEDVSHLVSHLVTASTFVPNSSQSEPLLQISPEGFEGSPFVVPAGQNFVITSVEIMPVANTSTQVVLTNLGAGSNYGFWTVSSTNTTLLQYPSGIVVGSGVNLGVFATQACTIAIHGYLSPA